MCTRGEASAFLQRMPRFVTTRASPWFSYLVAVYGTAELPLPFDLHGLRLLYQNDEHWQRIHVGVEWPMATCSCTRRRDSRQVCTTAENVEECDAARCARWLNNEQQLERTADAARRVKGFATFTHGRLVPFSSPACAGKPQQPECSRMLSSSAVVFSMPGDASRPPARADTWVEVFRTHQRNLPPCSLEGVDYYGCWFFLAPGSGIWLNTGERTHAAPTRTAVLDSPGSDGLLHRWLHAQLGSAAPGPSDPLPTSGGRKYTLNQSALPPRVLARIPSAVHGLKEAFPFIALELGLDSVQITRDIDGPGFKYLVATAAWECMRGRDPLGTCVALRTLRGWPPLGAGRPCRCSEELSLLNCGAQ